MKTKHYHLPPLCILIFVILHSSFSLLHSQVPNLVSYQGRVAVGTVNFEGTGQFRFALVNTAGTTVYWGNAADTTPADGVPDTAVSLPVSKGLYSVLLGDTSITNMASIPASVWANADVRLRVWFNDGVNGSQLLTPDQRLAPNGYLPDGSVGNAAIADNAITSAKINTGAVISGKIATGAITSVKLANNLALPGTTTGTFSGSGAALTNLNGGNITAGSIGSIQLGSGLTLGGTTTGTFSGNLLGNAATATSATNFTGSLAGDVTGTQSATSIAAATVTGKAITGFSSTTGTITASDTVLSAINKLNGNVALKAPLASPTFTGTVSGTFSGNGAALTNLNGASLTAGSVSGTQLAADVGLWSVSGANVFRSAGNVGIGINTPIAALDIAAPVGSVAGVRLGGSSLTASRYIGLGGSNGIGGPSDSFSGVEFGGPSGTSGGFVAFHTHHSGVAVAERMRIDQDGNVGIGTTTPQHQLDVAGYIRASGFIGNGATITGLSGANLADGSVTSAKIAADVGLWTASGANVYRFTGNVGIGTGGPTAPLQIIARNGGAPDTNGLNVFNPNNTAGSNAVLSTLVAGSSAGNPFVSFYVVGESGWNLGLDNADANKFKIASTTTIGSIGVPRMTITTDGKVGIGITVPAQALHVVGQGVFASSSVFSDPGGALGPAVVVGYNSSYDYGYVQALHSSVAPKPLILQPDAGAGNVGIGPGTPATKLDVKGEITCTAINLTSDRNAKEAFKPINARDVLAKVTRLPISEWQYRTRDQQTSDPARHIGPMAQDFHEAFALGHDDRHITSVDADGVALAAIQGLNEKLEEKNQEVQDLKKNVEELRDLVNKLARQQKGGAK